MTALRYFQAVSDLLATVMAGQGENIRAAAALVAEAIKAGGKVRAFGTGHSHLLAEEIYARAGGLTAVEPVLVPELMLHEGPIKSSFLERLPGFAAVCLDEEPGLDSRDVALVFSNSGRNAVPIEAARYFKARGMKVIAVTSLRHSLAVASRHPSGRRLCEVADLVIDNGGVVGDAIVDIPGLAARAGATSTVVGACMVQAILVEATALLAASGHDPGVITSYNVDVS